MRTAIVDLKLMLFGGFEAGPRLAVPTRKAQALLAYLGVRPGRSHPRDQLAALLWGEKSDDLARGALRHALVALRRGLGDGDRSFLRIDNQTVALDPVRIEVDVVTFERLVAEGTPQTLEQAAELYRGDLLLGFTLNEPVFEEWLVVERERLREMALDALAKLLAHQSKAGGTERAIQTAARLLGLDPLQEAAHRTDKNVSIPLMRGGRARRARRATPAGDRHLGGNILSPIRLFSDRSSCAGRR